MHNLDTVQYLKIYVNLYYAGTLRNVMEDCVCGKNESARCK